jgi:hypothetical protein
VNCHLFVKRKLTFVMALLLLPGPWELHYGGKARWADCLSIFSISAVFALRKIRICGRIIFKDGRKSQEQRRGPVHPE